MVSHRDRSLIRECCHQSLLPSSGLGDGGSGSGW